MPVYTYKCENCGVQFERTQRFSDEPLTRCPECSRKSLHKVYSPVGIVFKGKGFYATDNRSASGLTRTNHNLKSEGGSDSPSSESTTSEKSTTETKVTEKSPAAVSSAKSE
jgi:putative FmdB family regulatory protein